MKDDDKNKDIVTPLNKNETRKATCTPRWYVDGAKYDPTLATYRPLVNGEEAFREVHLAIEKAQKSVDIICWGFQPSMYFIRDGNHPSIGELLEQAAARNVMVRVLGWEYPLNAAGVIGEANLPGLPGIKDRAGQTASDKQYAYDCRWFRLYYFDPAINEKTAYRSAYSAGVMEGASNAMQQYTDLHPRTVEQRLADNEPVFVGRGFDAFERAEMMYRGKFQAEDKELSKATVALYGIGPTHHQKTVLVDYELPEIAVGFVMGHNMLDEYWDTNAHTSKNRTEGERLPPNLGPRGSLPRQDISSIVTGPILEYLHDNFAVAWQRATGEDLLTKRNAAEKAKQLQIRPEFGTPLVAQLLRTQSQEESEKIKENGKKSTFEEIKEYYLQMVPKATQFIYIENQYFRWPPMAEAIVNEAAGRQTKAGRDPRYHGSLHLFVISNVLDEGIGKGTLNTWRMLDILGRKDAIPEIARLKKLEQLDKETSWMPQGYYIDPGEAIKNNMKPDMELVNRANNYVKKYDKIKKGEMLPEERPGLKIHVCSLVAADSPPDNWMPVYIHSKLMIIDDVFTTHGSANINTRSMEVDSEMNISHDWMSVTRDLRRRLWNSHTAGRGVQDDAEKAFKKWEDLLAENKKLQSTKKDKPAAPLIQFLYDKPSISDFD